MATTEIDTLRFVRRPKDNGVPDAQSETMAEPVFTVVGALIPKMPRRRRADPIPRRDVRDGRPILCVRRALPRAHRRRRQRNRHPGRQPTNHLRRSAHPRRTAPPRGSRCTASARCSTIWPRLPRIAWWRRWPMPSRSTSSLDPPRSSAAPSSYSVFGWNVPSNASDNFLFHPERQRVGSYTSSKFSLV